MKETFGGAFLDVVGVACFLERAQEGENGHWVSTSERDVVHVDLNVLPVAAESPRRFFRHTLAFDRPRGRCDSRARL